MNIMKSNIFPALVLFVCLFTGQAQQMPAPPQSETISITGATLHLGNGQVIENGTITFNQGIITALGSGVAPAGRVIDASGKHVYPGFIAPVRPIGLIEINAVRATDDDAEIGGMIPHVRSIIAYNAESQIVESMMTAPTCTGPAASGGDAGGWVNPGGTSPTRSMRTRRRRYSGL